MKNLLKKGCESFIFLVVTLPVSTHAALMTFDNEAAWLSAVDVIVYEEDFESLTSTQRFGGGLSPYQLGSITFSSNATSEAEAELCVSTTTGCGGSGLAGAGNNVLRLASLEPAENVVITFNSDVKAFGFTWYAPETISERTISASIGAETFFSTPDANSLLSNDDRVGFFGVTSEVAFNSIALTSTGQQTDAFFDDLKFGIINGETGTVPEPSTLLLMSVGILGLRLVRRRKYS